MKYLLSILLLLAALSATAIELSGGEDGSVFIKLSATEAAQCKAEGGCAVVTAVALKRYVLHQCGTDL